MMQLNPQSEELDRAVLSIARSLYKQTPQLKKCHSQVNYCVVLNFDGVVQDRVIKLTHRNRWAIEVERYLYPAMKIKGLPVPEIEFTHQDYPEPSEPFIIMPKFSDYRLADLCNSDHQVALQACWKSGRFIQDLHERFAEDFKPFLKIEDLRGQLAAIQGILDTEIGLSLIIENEPELAETIEHHFASLSRRKMKRLIHGQLHNQNILANARGEICVVDFGETIGMSSPLQDLFWLLFSHDGWSTGKGNPDQRTSILEGYGTLDEVDVFEFRFWEFFHSVKSLRDHMMFTSDPDSIRQQANRIRDIADGKDLCPLL
jgi:aminoglycoside phosphotransferase (APT) family kinase protein